MTDESKERIMRFKRVLLVFPAFESDTGSSRPSPSIAYIAQSLEDRGIDFDILDMKLGYGIKDLEKRIKAFNPDLLGVTVFTLHHRTVYGIIERIRSAYPGLKIIVGGPHISITGKEALTECAAIDFACIHEGEDLIAELCGGNSLPEIKGLVYREGGEIRVNPPRPYETDLDRFGFPNLRKFELERYSNEILIISSRGCPYNCIFCSVHLVLGKRLRTRAISGVADELEYWYRRGRRIFNFVDDNFTFHEKRVYELCDEIERRRMSGLVLRASNGVRADKLDYPLLKRMKEVGFRSLGIGVESGSDNVLKALKKGEGIEQIENAIDAACSLGYEVALFFVFGAPGETLEDVEKSIEIALKYPVFKVDFYNLIPFPGTELYSWVNEKGGWTANPGELLNRSDKNLRFGSSVFFETKELPKAEQRKLAKRLVKVMRKVERRYLVRVLGKKIGPLAYPAASMISTGIVNRLYFNNNRLRRYAEKIRYALLR